MPPKSRAIILAGGTAIIVAIGAYTGATLKTTQERAQIRKEFTEESAEQKIARLEAAKARLMFTRTELQRKIDEIDAKKAGAEGRGAT